MATTLLLLVTGEQLEVTGAIEEVSKELENAARSGVGTLAWLMEASTDKRLGLYPAHVVTVRPGGE